MGTGLGVGVGGAVGTGVGVGVALGDGATEGGGHAVGAAVGDPAGMLSTGVGHTVSAGEPEGVGEAEAWQAVPARATARKSRAGRRQPADIGLVGVVLEAAHRRQRGVAEELGLALEEGQLGTEPGRGVGGLEQALLA